MIVIVDMADLNPAEIVAHVRVCHPEKALVVGVLRLLFDVVGPEVTGVSPSTTPFKITPWVSKVDNSDLFAKGVGDFASPEKTIGVLGDETQLFEDLC